MQKSATQGQREYILRVRDALKFAKDNFDITQERVADFIGVDQSTMSNYKTTRPLPQKYISKFCEITQVDPSWLISGQGSMTADAWMSKQMGLLQKLSSEEQSRFEMLMAITFPEKKH